MRKWIDLIPALQQRIEEAGPPVARLASVSGRSQGTFTPIYDSDLTLGLKPTSVMLLWTVLCRYWSMRSPLYAPGQERLMKQTGCSKKTIERGLQVLQMDRECRFRCGRDHPLVLVRWHGMGHNASIMPFTCDLAVTPRTPSPTHLLKRRSDASLQKSEASERTTVIDHIDASHPKVVRQHDAAFNGYKKLDKETAGDRSAANVKTTEWELARSMLAKFDVHHDQIVKLLAQYGTALCCRQAEALPFRDAFATSTNRAGLLVAAIKANWENPRKAELFAAIAIATEAVRTAEEARGREDQERAGQRLAQVCEILRELQSGAISEEAALIAVHGRPFDERPSVAVIQRRIAAIQLREAGDRDQSNQPAQFQ
jgi:hypothetical protein